MGWREAGIPDDFLGALEAEPRAAAAFDRASESYRTGILALVKEARDGEHRCDRIDLVIKTLLQQGSR